VQKPLRRLTSLRAFAALGVFAYHLGHDHLLSSNPAEFGSVGVSFFFVLSGFILVWATSPADRVWTFYRRRFARVYPAHFVTLLAAIVVPVIEVHRGLLAGLFSLTLTQAWVGKNSSIVYGMNGVSWSLSCEAFFYAIFPLVVLVVRRDDRRRIALLLLGSYVVAGFVTAAGFDPYANPLAQLNEFLVGMIAGAAFAGGWRPAIDLRVAGAGTVLLYVAVRAVKAPGGGYDALFAPAFAAILLAAARRDVAETGGWLASRWLVYAGEVSFCFYLVHEMVIVNLRPHMTGAGAVPVALIGSCVLAIALHHLVELPSQRLLRPAGKPAISSEGTLLAPTETA
jgi:peptidoglycan/LPS O-acetylase OafA/YrhL